MSDNLTGLLISLGCVLGPIWLVLHYRTKSRMAGRLSANDAALVEQISQTAQRLEQRVATLERILDAEVPVWRSSEAGGQFDRQAG